MEKGWIIGGLTSGIALGLLVIVLIPKSTVLILGVIWLGITVYLLKREHNIRKRQLEEISCQLNDILERKPLDISGILEDTLDDKLVSQMDKLQELLQHYDQMLWEEQESIKKLITDIAHQLRTPLANIKSYLNLCRQGETVEEVLFYLEAIQISEGKLAFLIESFIKISRLEHYCIQIKKEKQDIRETILQAMAMMGKKADAQQVELKLLTIEPCDVLHDKNWLCEAIRNLLDNSIKYSPAGSIVEIGVQNNEMFTRIQVRDYGIGIEEEEETSIFNRFYRGKRVTTQDGFGIGLYLAREIVLRHDGFMKVARKEQGLLVEIYLPR
jgi:signal transduction histidine kinase